MSRTRVVVTGLGTVNALGTDVDSFWSASLAGTSGVRVVNEFPIPPAMSRIAGVVADDWAAGEPLAASLSAGAGAPDRSLLLALAATREAVADAGYSLTELGDVGPRRVAVVISTAISAITSMEGSFRRWSAEGKEPIRAVTRVDGTGSPFQFGSLNAQVAAALGGIPRHYTVTTGCTGGIDAIGAACDLIRAGQADVVVTGAAEAPITPLVVAAFAQIGATSLRNDAPTRASRPFDVDRDGFVLAEGAGILVLESAQHAARRGARARAEISGFGSVNSCFHMTSMPDSGAPIAHASRLALADARVEPNEIDFVNLHGSSTPQNDLAEANAMRRVFGDRAGQIPITSIKSMTGHSLAAANAIEIVSAVRGIETGLVPPTINLDRQDPACPLDVVTGAARELPIHTILKTSSGFSGIHSSLVIERFGRRSEHAH
ncbi:beta-ketoacyl-[acyl-carrier-protein] synthase family protein [Frankia sp. Ag45/Mut15]|uniref:Beta-ketoacyl-[acyl-carrier-protein] synthase family protein n=1 Tax=Frankia umida TaxID=573489 RepID=A0ABT0JTC7_9ACTN|nr:beta-ketoacyl-[acyl-carrier-protein] synthase family protein [Frankia umida]MCK9874630.1 beta-ketoacyl-[acyl-carrier-protein] synthase family protein [Frankia umida]